MKGLLDLIMLRQQQQQQPAAAAGGTANVDSDASGYVRPQLSLEQAHGGLRALLDLLLCAASPGGSSSGSGAGDAPGAPAPTTAAAATSAVGAAAPSSSSIAPLPSEMKRLRYWRQVVAELSRASPLDEPPAAVRSFWAGVMRELAALAAGDSYSLRDYVAAVLPEIFTYFEPSTAQHLAGGSGNGNGNGGNGNGNGNGGNVNGNGGARRSGGEASTASDDVVVVSMGSGPLEVEVSAARGP